MHKVLGSPNIARDLKQQACQNRRSCLRGHHHCQTWVPNRLRCHEFECYISRNAHTVSIKADIGIDCSYKSRYRILEQGCSCQEMKCTTKPFLSDKGMPYCLLEDVVGHFRVGKPVAGQRVSSCGPLPVIVPPAWQCPLLPQACQQPLIFVLQALCISSLHALYGLLETCYIATCSIQCLLPQIHTECLQHPTACA